MIGEWLPTPEFWEALLRKEASTHVGHPYPFFLASPLEGRPLRWASVMIGWPNGNGRHPRPDRAARRRVFIVVAR